MTQMGIEFMQGQFLENLKGCRCTGKLNFLWQQHIHIYCKW